MNDIKHLEWNINQIIEEIISDENPGFLSRIRAGDGKEPLDPKLKGLTGMLVGLLYLSSDEKAKIMEYKTSVRDAIFYSMVLFSIHQQGHDEKSCMNDCSWRNKKDDNEPRDYQPALNLGDKLGKLVDQEPESFERIEKG